MARTHRFIGAQFSPQWAKSYASFQPAEQKGVDKVATALLKGETTPAT